MLKNMKISMSHTVRSERTCRLPACCISSCEEDDLDECTPVVVLGKNIWGAWPLIIWEATTAKRNHYRTN